LVYLSILFPNSYIILFWEFYLCPNHVISKPVFCDFSKTSVFVSYVILVFVLIEVPSLLDKYVSNMQDVKNSDWHFLQTLLANAGTVSMHHHLLLLPRMSLVGMVLRHRNNFTL
jgi:hypothetical protein